MAAGKARGKARPPKAADRVWQRTVARALQTADAAALPIHFHAAVLHHYLDGSSGGGSGAKVIRSNTVGRLLVPGRAVLDFGIVEDDTIIHLRFGDLLNLVPERDREHWLAHLAPRKQTRALSRPYLQMTLQPAACHDDGPLRPWIPEHPS